MAVKEAAKKKGQRGRHTKGESQKGKLIPHKDRTDKRGPPRKDPIAGKTYKQTLLPVLGSDEELTPQKMAFCQEYLATNFDRAKAYKLAGYTPSTDKIASEGASRLMREPLVQEEIKRLKVLRVERTKINQDYVLGRLVQNVERAMQIEPVFDKEGEPTGVYQYQGAVANRALEMIGKHIGLFPERYEHTGKDGKPIEHLHAHVPLESLNLPVETLTVLLEAVRKNKEKQQPKLITQLDPIIDVTATIKKPEEVENGSE